MTATKPLPPAHVDASLFTEAAPWADPERIAAGLAVMRREAPVAWITDQPAFNPFWLVSRHEDVLAIERDPKLFISGPRTYLMVKEADLDHTAGKGVRTLVNMDGIEHRDYRAVSAPFFRPGTLRTIEEKIHALAVEAVDGLLALPGEADFATEIALRFPLRVILSIMGLPEADYPRMLKLTQEMFGATDPDLQRDTDPEAIWETIADFAKYFGALTAERVAHPTGDLASVIANGEPGGCPMGDLEKMSYYVIIATAGHDTTSSAIAGGLLALLQNPKQLELLRRNPQLIDGAVEEIIRWTTPVRHFMRTATADCEVGGVRIAEGESLLLSYVSANRDESVFAEADKFDIMRPTGKQLAFGFGTHHCIGAPLARLEIRMLLTELLARVESIELTGEARFSQARFVSGVKNLPIRFSAKD